MDVWMIATTIGGGREAAGKIRDMAPPFNLDIEWWEGDGGEEEEAREEEEEEERDSSATVPPTREPEESDLAAPPPSKRARGNSGNESIREEQDDIVFEGEIKFLPADAFAVDGEEVVATTDAEECVVNGEVVDAVREEDNRCELDLPPSEESTQKENETPAAARNGNGRLPRRRPGMKGCTIVEIRGSLDDRFGDSFCALVDLKVTIGGEEITSIGNLWPCGVVERFQSPPNQDEEKKRPPIEIRYRVKCARSEWYVDVMRLQQFGPTFEAWKQLSDDGTKQVVSLEDPDDLECLLEALQGYDQPLVHRGNVFRLMPMAERIRAHALLRLCEEYLLSSSLHPIRAMELAAMHRMARLFDYGQRNLGKTRLEALEILHRYLASCSSSLEDLHPAVAAAFNITRNSIII